MQEWMTEYKSKIVTADEAVSHGFDCLCSCMWRIPGIN